VDLAFVQKTIFLALLHACFTNDFGSKAHPETNIAPEEKPFQKESRFPAINF